MRNFYFPSATCDIISGPKFQILCYLSTFQALRFPVISRGAHSTGLLFGVKRKGETRRKSCSFLLNFCQSFISLIDNGCATQIQPEGHITVLSPTTSAPSTQTHITKSCIRHSRKLASRRRARHRDRTETVRQRWGQSNLLHSFQNQVQCIFTLTQQADAETKVCFRYAQRIVVVSVDPAAAASQAYHPPPPSPKWMNEPQALTSLSLRAASRETMVWPLCSWQHSWQMHC